MSLTNLQIELTNDCDFEYNLLLGIASKKWHFDYIQQRIQLINLELNALKWKKAVKKTTKKELMHKWKSQLLIEKAVVLRPPINNVYEERFPSVK